jgi:NADP-dependent 3-hydroxy acid dehydrogenase YdfG
MDNFDVSKLFTVEGLVVVVTGGGTGLGLCTDPSEKTSRLTLDISSALAQNGAIVYIVGRRKEKLETAVKMHQSVIPSVLELIVAYERQIDSTCR